LIRDLEVVNPYHGDPGQAGNSSDYSVWITKKPVDRTNSVKLLYIQERGADALRAADLLRGQKFTVTLEQVSLNENDRLTRQRKLTFQTGQGGTAAEARDIAAIVRAVETVEVLEKQTDAVRREVYNLWIVSKNEEKPLDLNGRWLGRNYNCPEDPRVQDIHIEHIGDQVLGIKVVGNQCIGADEVTFRARFSGRTLTARCGI
jgi:hypothetical protein